MNASAENLTGWLESEALGLRLRKVLRAIDQRTRKEMEDPAAEVLRSGRAVDYSRHLALISRGGSEKGVVLSCTPIREADERVSGVLALFRDISVEKRTGRANRLLASIVESSDDAIYAKTLDGTILSWNGGAERIYGYTADEVIGKNVSVLVPPDMYDEVPEMLGKIGRGDRIAHYETVRIRKDGSRVHVSMSLSPLADESG